jgi:hypothetical protein
VIGGFEVLQDGISASERNSYVCVFEQVGNFSNQGGGEGVKADHLVGADFSGTGEGVLG